MKTFVPLGLFSLLVVVLLTSCDKTPPEAQLPVVSVADIQFPEGNVTNTVSIPVKLSEASSANVVLNFSTKDLSAAAGVDYVSQSNSQLIIAAGETQGVITVSLLGDNVFEPNETFEIVLLQAINAQIIESKAVITIANDDNVNGIVIPSGGYETPTSYPGMTLVWQDEFDSGSLNTNYWTHEIGNGQNGWGNQELQYYRPENTSFVDGNMVISAKAELYGGRSYTSSRIITRDKKTVKFGRIDIRAVAPKGQGLWPALWMLGENFGSTGWPACGEIDIMELVGHQPNRVHGTVHFGNQATGHQQNGASRSLSGTATFADEYHVFSIVWKEDMIQWFVDDVLYHTVTPATTTPAPYPFNQPFFFIFNVAVGGQWPGSPNATTNFPQHFIIDYVRVFQE
jgi:beta-glucanase (GH16 family)